VRQAYAAAAGEDVDAGAAAAAAGDGKRKPVDGAECPICYEELKVAVILICYMSYMLYVATQIHRASYAGSKAICSCRLVSYSFAAAGGWRAAGVVLNMLPTTRPSSD
jgi:hypothetical protein